MPDFDAFHAFEHQGWSDPATAADYAARFGMAANQCVPAMVAAAHIKPGARVLDLCCGHGNVTLGLVEAGADVTGLDFSDTMLDMARTQVPQARFMQGDAMDLPFDEGRFDAVTIGFGIPHIPYPERCLREAKRVLHKGGRLVFSAWHGAEKPSAFAFLFEAVAQHGDPSIKLPPGPGAHDFADLTHARKALIKYGFSDIEQVSVDSHWQVEDPEVPFDYILHGTVRGSALLRPQPAANQAAIRAVIAAKVKVFDGDDSPWRVPIPAAITSATA